MRTKDKIILESLKLFSVSGFDAVSVRQIAQAVGVNNSALYKHFENKQAILEAIIEQARTHFLHKAQEEIDTVMDLSKLEEMCIRMYAFQTQDDWMVMIRKLLIVEQFKNQEMSEMYQSFFIHHPIDMMTNIFSHAVCQKILKNEDPEVMAMQLYAPFFMFHLAQRDSLIEKFKIHVQQFIKMYAVMEGQTQ